MRVPSGYAANMRFADSTSRWTSLPYLLTSEYAAVKPTVQPHKTDTHSGIILHLQRKFRHYSV